MRSLYARVFFIWVIMARRVLSHNVIVALSVLLLCHVGSLQRNLFQRKRSSSFLFWFLPTEVIIHRDSVLRAVHSCAAPAMSTDHSAPALLISWSTGECRWAICSSLVTGKMSSSVDYSIRSALRPSVLAEYFCGLIFGQGSLFTCFW